VTTASERLLIDRLPAAIVRSARRWRAIAFALWLASVVGATFASEASRPTSDQVKAAYLHKFAGYVDWPASVLASPEAPFVVGVAGAESVYLELEKLAVARPVGGRSVEVRRLRRPDPEPGMHLVFIGKEFAGELWSWLAAFEGHAILTVTETPGGLEAGAVLNFVEVGNRVRFEASLRAAEAAGLKLSSRLLAVAQRVAGASQ
jgi:hypothetical protein